MRVRHDKRVPSWVVGVFAVLLIAVGSILAWTKELPFGDPYEVRAVFPSAQNVRTGSPVRIAGIDIGEVTNAQPLGAADEALTAQADGEIPAEGTSAQQAALVTMEISEEGRPIREDATFKMRPRLFLEGNQFVDLQPGSPNAAEVEDGHTFPINQTSNTVELDQILTALQSDVRRDLQILLDQFGNALIRYGGADGFRELYRSSGPAFKYTAQVQEAMLGTEHGDLRGFISGLSRVLGGLARNEERLSDLVTNFRIFTGSFARQHEALGRAIEELPLVMEASKPAYANLNAAFPSLRAFAREALPGVRTTPETIEAALPFVQQVRALVSRRELLGLVSDLRPTVPRLASFARQTELFLRQSRQLSSCFNEVFIRWANDTVDPPEVYPHDPAGRVFEVTGYGISGINGENRSGDANANYLRTHGGGGATSVAIPTPFDNPLALGAETLLGGMPAHGDSRKTRFRPNVRCETQEPPDLGAGGFLFGEPGAPPPFTPLSSGTRGASIDDEALGELEGLAEALESDDGREARRARRQLGNMLLLGDSSTAGQLGAADPEDESR